MLKDERTVFLRNVGKPFTPWRVVTSQKNGFPNHTSVKTSRLDTYGIIWKQKHHALVMSRNRPFDEEGNCVQHLWRSEMGKFVTFVKWPRDETSSRLGHEKKSDHFLKWAFLKMGWRVCYFETVVLENSYICLHINKQPVTCDSPLADLDRWRTPIHRSGDNSEPSHVSW